VGSVIQARESQGGQPVPHALASMLAARDGWRVTARIAAVA
jgi:hypothetical protein